MVDGAALSGATRRDHALHRALDELYRTSAWTWTETDRWRCHETGDDGEDAVRGGDGLAVGPSNPSWTSSLPESPETDRLLASLQTPAHQSLFVIQRAVRTSVDETSAVATTEEASASSSSSTSTLSSHDVVELVERVLMNHCRHLLKPRYRFVVLAVPPPAAAAADTCQGGIPSTPPEGAAKANDASDVLPSSLSLSSLTTLLRSCHQPGGCYTVQHEDGDVPAGWRPAAAVGGGADAAVGTNSSKAIAQMIADLVVTAPTGDCKKSKTGNGTMTMMGTTNTQPTTAETVHSLLRTLYNHLWYCLGTDLRNGMSADVAVLLSGVPGRMDDTMASSTTSPNDVATINSLLDVMCHIAALELRRKCNKGSRRAADMLRTVEKLAAAGCERTHGSIHNDDDEDARRGDRPSTYFRMACHEAALSLQGSRGYENLTHASSSLSSSSVAEEVRNMTLFSHRPLLFLWRRGKAYHKTSTADVRTAMSVQDLLRPSHSPLHRFDDPTLPLVVDVGCGLGVSLIGLAALSTTTGSSSSSSSPSSLTRLGLDWTRCNYLGADLSSEAVQWATSLTGRWQLDGRCQFCHASAETLLDYLKFWQQRRGSSDGGGCSDDVTNGGATLTPNAKIALMLLQFPTPYRLATPASVGGDERVGGDNGVDATGTVSDGAESGTANATSSSQSKPKSGSGCNETLPIGPDDDSFMANPRILRRMADLLSPMETFVGDRGDRADAGTRKDDGPSFLLVQSNCEDVALYIHDALTECEASAMPAPPLDDVVVMEAVPCDNPRLSSPMDDDDDDDTGETLTSTARTQAWLQLLQSPTSLPLRTGDDDVLRRATGQVWSAEPLLPVATETEASCHHQRTPIHRCVFRRRKR